MVSKGQPMSAPLPAPHILRSALRAGRVIDPDGTPVSTARTSYGRVPFNGIYRVEDLTAGEEVLIRAGLLTNEDGVLLPVEGLGAVSRADDAAGTEALVTVLLAREPPPWLLAAAGEDGFASELVPDRELDVLVKTMDPEAREQLLLQAAQRFSSDAQEKTGALAEEFVVKECRKELFNAGESGLADQVQRVSLISDQLGYDITAPRPDGTSRRIECKGTRAIPPRLFLSRNEAGRALADPHWFLVLCIFDKSDGVSLGGWCQGTDLKPLFPIDQVGGKWASVEIQIPDGLMKDGLPPLVQS